jgi:hypothetical protein
VIKTAQEMHRAVRESHGRVHEAIKRLEAEAKACTDIQELADISYATDKAWKMVDDTRKEMNKLHELVEKITGAMWAMTAAIHDGEPIRTAYCTATPSAKPVASIPTRKNDPEGYTKLMSALGVPPELANFASEDGRELIELHWPTFMKMLEARLAAGLPLPPGIDPDKTYTKYGLAIRPKKGVEE